MAKGYWIAHVDVADAEAYKAYQSANAIAFAKYGARFLVRAGRNEPKEGALRSRHVVIEFKDSQSAGQMRPEDPDAEYKYRYVLMPMRI